MSWSGDGGDEPKRDLPTAGWYDDPGGSGVQRYWDGEAWTEQLSGQHARPTEPAETTPPPPAARRRQLPWKRIGLASLAVLVLVGLLAGSWVISRVVDDTDERLADSKTELDGAREELADTKTQVENLNKRAEAAEKERDKLADQVTALTGEEEAGAGLEGVKIVSKGKTLKLEELEATLVSYAVTDTVSDEFDTRRADGKFITATVTIKNRLSSPQQVDPEEHFALVIDGEEFTPDFDAMNYAGGDESWLSVGLDGLQPGTPKTGTVTFDVSPEAAASAADGTLLVVQFSDASGFGDEEPGLPVAGLKMK